MKTLHKWSVEDYHRIIDTGILADQRVELLEGEIAEMSPEGIPHTYTSQSVVEYLRQLLKDQAIVREGHPITLNNSEPQPDIAIVRNPISIYAQHHPYSEDIYWLIEISNTTLSKDKSDKKAIYARASIAEYWIIDLQNNQLLIFTNPQGEDYLQLKEITTGIINPLAFPKINVEVNKLLIT
jgi:Uma2 family endonuclease